MRAVPEQEPASDLMARVGGRVRAARTEAGLSRQALSDASGVSQRYLAQLESGQGNISIALLERVAQALRKPIETLVQPECPEPDQTARVAEAYSNASDDVQARVRDLLLSGPARANRVSLIGLRGAGKSTLGRLLAKAQNAPFIELNAQIEALGQIPVSEIMALYGPEGYRALEAEALAAVLDQHDRVVLAVAGGIVSDRHAFETLLSRSHAVWLRATAEEHMSRVRAQGDLRPMAGRPEAMAQLKVILSARETEYARASAQFDTSGQSVTAARDGLERLVLARGYLG